MSKKKISQVLKAMLVVLGVFGFICCANTPWIVDYIFPGWSNVTQHIWIGIIWVSAMPCFAALVPSWLIADNIGKDCSFSEKNVQHTKEIGILMAANTVILFLANLLTFAFGRSFFAFFISFYLVIAIFFAAAVVAFSMSALLKNATALQNQSDFTI